MGEGSGECDACLAADQSIFGTQRRRQQGELATCSGAITAAHIGSKQVGFKAAGALCLCLAPWPSLRTWSVTSHGARGPSCDGPRELASLLVEARALQRRPLLVSPVGVEI